MFLSSVIAWLGDCVVIAVCHCETALSRCGNLMFLIVCEIASLIVFVRKDITTQSLDQAIQLVLFVIATSPHLRTRKRSIFLNSQL